MRLVAEIEKVADEIQALAIFALQQAKLGDSKCANQVVDAVVETAIFQPDYIIEWFEVFGRLKWSNKKGRLVHSDQGRWLIAKAKRSHWANLVLGNLPKGHIKKSPSLQTSTEPLTEANFSETIGAYLNAHPLDSGQIGRYGVPADKKRWGRYKIKVKHK